MKIKYYLRGLGIGIIVTTLILSFRKTDLTDQEIIDMAGKLGMVMKEDPKGNLDEVYAQLEKDKSSGEDPKREDRIDSNDNSSLGAENPSTAESKTKDEEPSKSDEELIDGTKNEPKQDDVSSMDNGEAVSAEQGNSTVVELISFYIPEGMSSDRVSQILEGMGVIADAYNFNEYVKSQGKATKIRTGKFSLASNAPYEEILEVITNEGE